ncbi:MAG TPA: hypothetical protein VK451_10340 [Methyloceanibacter sp.]|nr:hypothetical protein [Methyloceanibacter sp.]
MKPVCKSGAAVATAVAAVIATVAPPVGVASADHAKGKCIGANACKGQSDCGGKNGCPGQNACKGKGYLELTKAACAKIPGTRFKPE